jgi:uncharacterized protein
MKRTLVALVGFTTAMIVALPAMHGQTDSSRPTGKPAVPFKVVAFYTANVEAAHRSFVQEANAWFSKKASQYNFIYEPTANWDNLNSEYLSKYQVIVFLDARPDAPDQRAAFETYMAHGGAWMGFHYSAFALTPSAVPQNWDWYHNRFLGAGEYAGNTWRPTSAVLRVEDPNHPATHGLPKTFKSSPNEWYRWQFNLRDNKDIKVLLSIDPSSFPLGTGPKPHEIWHSGDYPVVWTHLKYRMIYFNMGHNDLDFDPKPPRELSFTFGNESQDKLILNCLLWLDRGTNK